MVSVCDLSAAFRFSLNYSENLQDPNDSTTVVDCWWLEYSIAHGAKMAERFSPHRSLLNLANKTVKPTQH